MLPGGEKVAEVDKVSATVHRGSSLSGMLGIVDDLCTLSEQSKLCDSSLQHTASSVLVHTVVLHHITASNPALFSSPTLSALFSKPSASPNTLPASGAAVPLHVAKERRLSRQRRGSGRVGR